MLYEVITLDKVTVSVFAECLGSRFRMHVEPGRVLEVELIEALTLPDQLLGPRNGSYNFV